MKEGLASLDEHNTTKESVEYTATGIFSAKEELAVAARVRIECTRNVVW